jgi:hypothetical protein
VLDLSFYGLDSAQPSYTAAIEREARALADSSPVSGEDPQISMFRQVATVCAASTDLQNRSTAAIVS